MKNNYVNIREAANILNVSIDTLRRWDKSGKLKSIREKAGKHRLYRREDLELFKTNLFDLAMKWASDKKGYELEDKFYCQNSSIFQSRLNYLTEDLKKISKLTNIYPLISLIAGEVGNNSFDHNLGNWSDVPGIFFGYNVNKKEIVLADRGQGVFHTLKRVIPGLKNHKEALFIAFTEIISGRAPERRGNGLKLVRAVIEKNPISLKFQSGDALLKLQRDDKKLNIKQGQTHIKGCIALIKF